jgi:hypothetical protein
MKRLLLFLPLLLGLPLHAQTLSVCAEPWEPFIYRNPDGEAAGLVAQVLQNIANNSDYRFKFYFRSLAGCKVLMKQHQIDVFAFGSPGKPPEGWIDTRELLVAWAIYAWVPDDAPWTRYSKELAAGKKVAWVYSYDYPAVLNKDKNFTRIPADDTDAAVDMLANHRIDLMFDDPVATKDVDAERSQRVRRLEPLVASVIQPFSLRTGLEKLRDLIDQETLKMQQDGSLNNFYLRNIGPSFKEVQQSLD